MTVGPHPTTHGLSAAQISAGAVPPKRVSTEQAPADQEARDAVAFDLDHTVFAVAGAGSGKTRHLVDRVLHILLSGAARIDQLAAITFTEAAAAELRDRIAEALETVAGGPEGGSGRAEAVGGGGTWGASEAQRATTALAGLDGAAITTLHGFARRVLSEHPFEAGLPPVFEVLDEVRSSAELDERWDEVVDAVLDDPGSARALQWAVACGGTLDGFRLIARQLAADWDLAGDQRLSARLPAVDARTVLEPLSSALAMASGCSDPQDSLVDHLDRLVPLASRLECARGDELEILRLLAGHPGKLSAGRKGKAGSWHGEKDVVLALLTQAETARRQLVGRAVDAALGTIGAALGAHTSAAARRRQREGRLAFHDLLVLARDVVRDNPEVRTELHGQYRYLLVDEFQDTDPLQAELVVLISAEEGAAVGSVPWHELPVVRGSLFFVGDPHQSIYRFRRADIETFLLTWERIATRTARLVTNFRSVPGIVQWVDEVFGQLVGDGGTGGQPPYTPAVPARRSGDGAASAPGGGGTQLDAPGGRLRCPVTVLGVGADRAGRAPDARRREADDVVATLVGAVEEGWQVGTDRRRVRPSDITVLVPARTSLPSLQESLEAAGLAYRLQSSSLVYAAPEVRDLLFVLEAVDDPADEAAVVAALRTPGFGCGDDDLLRYRLAGGSWDYRTGSPAAVPDGDPVRRGLAELRALHDARAWTGVSDLVARVVDERRMLESALDGDRWREEWRRLRFVVDQARQFTETSPGGLRQYLAWVDVQRAEDARVTEVVLPEIDVEAVSIMTVHAAKGLEFPVVAVVGLGATPQGVRAPRVLFGSEGPELALRADLCTDGYDDLRRREGTLEAQERLRLLYVAVTRAQDHLVVSVHRAEGARTSTAALLEDALPDPGGDLWRVGRPSPPPSARSADDPEAAGPEATTTARALEDRGGGTAEDPGTAEHQGTPEHREASGAFDTAEHRAAPEDRDTAEALAQWTAERARRLELGPAAISATAVAKLALSPDGAPGPDGARELEEDDETAAGTGADGVRRMWRRGRGGTAVGRAVHAVLQSVDLATGDGLGQLADLHAAAEGVPARRTEVAALARVALGSDVVRRAISGRYWRELYVAAPIGSRVLEGFVDLLFEGSEGLEVVDYKTDQVTGDADIDRMIGRHRLQGAAYALAVEAAVGRPVRRCSFVFLRAGFAVTRTVTDLDRAMAEVRLVVEGGGQRPVGDSKWMGDEETPVRPSSP